MKKKILLYGLAKEISEMDKRAKEKIAYIFDATGLDVLYLSCPTFVPVRAKTQDTDDGLRSPWIEMSVAAVSRSEEDGFMYARSKGNEKKEMIDYMCLSSILMIYGAIINDLESGRLTGGQGRVPIVLKEE